MSNPVAFDASAASLSCLAWLRAALSCPVASIMSKEVELAFCRPSALIKIPGLVAKLECSA
nr:hypothetical protein [Commensalibacter intestini]